MGNFGWLGFQESWKLISGDEPLELYDRSEDASEKDNRVRADDLPETARQLLGATFSRPAEPESEGVTLSPQEQERLRALGYIH